MAVKRKRLHLDKDLATMATANAEAMGAIIGLGKDAIHKHCRENGAPKQANGRYPVAKFVQWYAERMREGSDQAKDEKRRLTRAQRQRAELELQQRQGELIELEEMQRVLLEVATITTRIEGLAARVAGRVAGMTSTAEIKELLLSETRDIRSDISKAIVDYADTARRGEGDRATANNKRGKVGGRKPKNATRRTRAGAVAD